MSLARCLALLLALGACALPARAEEPAPADAAQVEIVLKPERCVVGEVVEVTLLVRYLPDFFDAHGATLFRRPLDLEVQLTAPWLNALEGAAVLSSDALGVNVGPGDWVRLAINGEVASLPRSGPVEKDGRSWSVLTARCRILPKKAGAMELAAPVLKYAYAERIEENLMGERTASASTPVTIEGTSATLTVEAPPAEGQPDGFGGAVGTFSVEARVETPEVEVNQPFELTLVVTGEGNLGLIEQPRLPEMLGIHVYGAKEDPSEEPMPARRVIRYEVAVTAGGINKIPAIPFAYFDPATGYQEARTAPIALRVAGGEAAPAPAQDMPAAQPTTTTREERDDRPPPLAFLGLAILAGLLVIGGGVAMLIKLRPRATPPPPVRRVGMPPIKPKPTPPPPRPSPQAAEQALRAAVDGGDDDARFRGFVDLLAAHLGCGPGSVVDGALAEHLRAAGVADDLATEAGATMDAMVEARYGAGAAPTLDATLVDRLVAALRRPIGGAP